MVNLDVKDPDVGSDPGGCQSRVTRIKKYKQVDDLYSVLIAVQH